MTTIPIWATKPKVKIMGLFIDAEKESPAENHAASPSAPQTKTPNSPMIARAIGLIPKLHSGRR
jgi:hypothetical protein